MVTFRDQPWYSIPADVGERLERLNGINHAGLYFTIPDNGTLQPRTTPATPLNPGTPVPVIAAQPGALAAGSTRWRRDGWFRGWVGLVCVARLVCRRGVGRGVGSDRSSRTLARNA